MQQVAEVVPLKQGLKHIQFLYCIFCSSRCRGSSIKTRIETNSKPVSIPSKASVAEVVPLKQGLKPEESKKKAYHRLYVAEVVPLKQGLKHYVII